jgi:hypothetical protein
MGNTTIIDKDGFATITQEITIYTYSKLGDEWAFASGERMYLIKGVGLPPNSTLEPPPTNVPENSAAFWDQNKESWIVDKNYINQKIYHKKTFKEHTMTVRGDIPKEFTLIPYPGEGYEWSTENDNWVMRQDYKEKLTLDNKTKERSSALNTLLDNIAKCDILINSGTSVDYYTGLKEKYQATLRKIYELDISEDIKADIPTVEPFVL